MNKFLRGAGFVATVLAPIGPVFAADRVTVVCYANPTNMSAGPSRRGNHHDSLHPPIPQFGVDHGAIQRHSSTLSN